MSGPLFNLGCLDHGNGSQAQGVGRFEAKQVSLPDIAPENLTAGWQEAKIYVTSPEPFFPPAENLLAAEMSQGSEDNFLLEKTGLGV